MSVRPVDMRSGAGTWVRGVGYQAWIFFKRGFTHNTSYRLYFGLSIFNLFVGLISYYFLSKIVGANKLGTFANHKAAFIIVGTSMLTFVGVSLSSYATSLRTEMFLGTIEHWLLSASPMTRLVALSTIWEFAWPLFTTAVTFTLLSLVLGVRLDPDITTTVVCFVLTVVVMSGFGLISAGIIMVSKIGDPLAVAWSVVTTLLSGALYPITVLPGWLQFFSHALPPFYAVDGLRRGIVLHTSLGHELHVVVVLAGFAAASVPLGAITFRLGLERARAQGTLSQF